MIRFLASRILGLAIALALPSAAVAADPAVAPSLHFEALDIPMRMASDGEGLVDVGSVAADPGISSRGIVIRQRIGVRIDGMPGGSARLDVALIEDVPGTTARIDGVPVSTVPRTIDAIHRIGSTVVHELEFLISPDAQPGAFMANLVWTIETD